MAWLWTERGEKDRRGVQYSRAFRQQMVKKLVGPGARTATALAAETGVPQQTLSRWLREAGSLPAMSEEKNGNGMVAKRRPQDWRVEEKLRAVLEATSLSDEELGAFLRQKGLHEAQLAEWREAAFSALSSRSTKRGGKGEAKRIRELERELKRKDKALAETAALLVLKKKVQAIWGDGDDDTEPKNGKRSWV